MTMSSCISGLRKHEFSEYDTFGENMIFQDVISVWVNRIFGDIIPVEENVIFGDMILI